MSNEEEEFQKHLLDVFRVEAHERLTTLSSGLIELEQAETDGRRAEVLEILVRDAHSLKGAARVVNLAEMVALGRGMESVLTALKRQEIAAAAELFDILHAAVDGAGRFLAAAQTETAAKETADLLESIRAMEHAAVAGGQAQAPIKIAPPLETKIETPLETPPVVKEPASPPASSTGALTPAERSASSETVRIPAARLGALLLEAEQLLSSKLAAEHYVSELKSVHRTLAEWEKELAKIGSTLRRSSLAKPAGKSALIDLLEAENQRIRLLRNRLGMLERSTEQNYHFLSVAVNNLLEDMKGILMLPFSTLLEIFPKMVRDLSRDRGKEVDLIIAGGNIEIDKRILDELKDALIHLVRNCIDHGIERPEVREGRGKPRRGKLAFSVTHKDAGKVEISFEDDGAGLDSDKIRAAAVKSGVLSAAEAKKLSDEEAQFLVFRSGVTTSPTVTDISGRGLGLAIVQEKVVKLNGTLTFDSRPNVGTTFRLVLPLTLATFRGVVIRCGEYPFIIPTVNVDRVLRIDRNQVKTVENCKTIRIRNELVALVKLAEVLELHTKTVAEATAKMQVIVIGGGSARIAFEVDEILNEQEVLVKPLGKQLARVRNISGATILGAGQVAPILNVADLLTSAMHWSTASIPRQTIEKVEEEAKSLLVVEDSITTRTLLKNILEASGYDVGTAVDGLDALTQLRERSFDLVVSDVMMPRLNGFELTSKIREDKRLTEIPVVLVTAQESLEDRERGIEVGANAYIVKSSFDQSNLLETIRRLV